MKTGTQKAMFWLLLSLPILSFGGGTYVQSHNTIVGVYSDTYSPNDTYAATPPPATDRGGGTYLVSPGAFMGTDAQGSFLYTPGAVMESGSGGTYLSTPGVMLGPNGSVWVRP